MAAKPIPEYMKRFMENIGHESFTDYQNLSAEYHNTIQAYHELKFPKRVPVGGRYAPQHDMQADLDRIEEDFKGRSMDMACKSYGYSDPGYEYFDHGITDRQEAGEYNNVLKESFGLSREDIRALKAHNTFEAKHPEKAADRQSNREVIELYLGEGEGPMQPRKESPVKEAKQQLPEIERKKEPLSRGELFKTYTAEKQTMTEVKNRFSMADRFFMTLPSERQARESIEDPHRNMSKDRDGIEMERDI